MGTGDENLTAHAQFRQCGICHAWAEWEEPPPLSAKLHGPYYHLQGVCFHTVISPAKESGWKCTQMIHVQLNMVLPPLYTFLM